MGVQQSATKKKVGRKPKFDYTGEEFLNRISELAKKGYSDRDIAFAIGMNETYFYEKKAECEPISEALAHARSQLNTVVRGAFLKAALGGRLVKKYSYVQKRCECKGKPDCPICDGTGWITPEQHRVVEEYEQAPNLMAQNRWLMNYDADWKKKVNGVDEEAENSTVEGFDIEVTFNKKEDLELQERVKKKEE